MQLNQDEEKSRSKFLLMFTPGFSCVDSMKLIKNCKHLSYTVNILVQNKKIPNCMALIEACNQDNSILFQSLLII